MGLTLLPGGLGRLSQTQALCLQVVFQDDNQSEVAGSQCAQDAVRAWESISTQPGEREERSPSGSWEEVTWGTGCLGMGHHRDSPGGTWSTSGSRSPWGQRVGR